jgi:hypothetical protein
MGIMKGDRGVCDMNAAKGSSYARGGERRSEVTLQPMKKCSPRIRAHICFDVHDFTAHPETQLQQVQNMAGRALATLLIRPHSKKHMSEFACVDVGNGCARGLQCMFHVKLRSIFYLSI